MSRRSNAMSSPMPGARRRALGTLAGAGFALTPLAAMLAACDRSSLPEGMVEIRWDRDTCTRCNMIIGDRRFAAQLNGGPERRSYKFDDIGCVVVWLAGRPWGADAATRIWVMDSGDGRTWLDARKARYVGGKTSPMGYDFAATGAESPGSLDFEDMRRHVLAKNR